MPLYPMQCRLPERGPDDGLYSQTCGHKWDWHTRTGYYTRSAAINFDNVYCPKCGRRGAKRIWPTDAIPAMPRVEGRWGETAPKGLRGLRYSSKEERDAQIAKFGDPGQTVVPTGGRGPSAVGKLSALSMKPEAKSEPEVEAKPERKWEPTKTVEPKASPAELAVLRLLEENGEMRTGQIIDELDYSPTTVNRVLAASAKIRKVGRGRWEAT